MPSLVHTFIVLAGAALAVAFYRGLGPTPVEAVLAGFTFVAIALVVLERSLRRRAEARLLATVADLSQRLSDEVAAGAARQQRLAALASENAGQRLETLESDVDLLGTVTRQVAETVAEFEARRGPAAAPPTSEPLPATAAAESVDPAPGLAAVPARPAERRPRIPPETLVRAIEANRLVFHLQPVVALPLRRPQTYDVVPRLALGDGGFAEPPDFLPGRGGEALLCRIEQLALEAAVTIGRRARARGQPAVLNVPLSRASLADAAAMESLAGVLAADAELARGLVLVVPANDWAGLTPAETGRLAGLTRQGVRLGLADAHSLRLDFPTLFAAGVRSVRVDAAAFAAAPERFTDFLAADVAGYLKRFDIDLVATGVHTEEQVLMLLEDNVVLVQGPHVVPPAPAGADLAEAGSGPRRAQA